MIKTGALRTESIPRVRITEEEKKLVSKRVKFLNMNWGEYVRYCINKEMESENE